MNVALDKMVEKYEGNKKNLCRDTVALMAPALIGSFGLDFDNLAAPSNETRGYQKAEIFLDQVCRTFADPSHIIRVAPFAQAYLGPEAFQEALNVVLDRAQTHKEEQPLLDEVFTGMSLLSPSLRDAFLHEVASAPVIDKDFFSLEYTIAKLDPKLAFSRAAEFPKAFNTSDVNKAAKLLSYFLETGLFHPTSGFSEEYSKLLTSMHGFGYMLNEPNEKVVLVIAPQHRREPIKRTIRDVTLKFTSAYDQRDAKYEENPAIVVVNTPTKLDDVKRLYRNSTVIYVASDDAEQAKMKILLANAGTLLIPARDKERLLASHVAFIRKARAEYGSLDLSDLLQKELAKAEKLIQEGNEFFYDVRDQFETLDKKDIVDAMVGKGNYELPIRTDNSLIILLSDKNKLQEYFGEYGRDYGRKKIRTFKDLPNIRETGMPFVLLTDKPIPARELTQKYKTLTLVYVAHSDADEKAIQKANEGSPVFILNVPRAEKVMGRDPYAIGREFMNIFFDEIGKYRGKGITDMNTIGNTIASKAKESRDKLIFAPTIDDFYVVGMEYFRVQEKYRMVPEMLVRADPALQETLFDWQKMRLGQPETGGCCGGGNLPDVLIKFAIDYRKTVGDKAFLQEWKARQNGKPQMPWYAQRREYAKQFPKFEAEQGKPMDRLRF
jgi:hypothetical protein